MTKEQLLEYIDVYIRQQGDYGAVRIAPVLETLVNNMGKGGVIPSGGTADRPENPVVGTQYFDTDLGKVVTWDGSEWVEPAAGQGTVLLHVDTGSATEDGETTTYRFTETQEEINAIIDKLGGAEAVTVIVQMMREGELQMMYSIPCVRMEQDGMTYYLGINVGLDTQAQMDDVASSMKVAQITLSSSLSSFAFMGTSSGSIRDYLGITQSYRKLLLGLAKDGDGYYMSSSGEKVADENFGIYNIRPGQYGGYLNEDEVIVIKTKTPTNRNIAILYHSGSSSFNTYLKGSPGSISSTVSTHIYVNNSQRLVANISMHKEGEVYVFDSRVLGFLAQRIFELSRAIGANGIIQADVDEKDTGVMSHKYNNTAGGVTEKSSSDHANIVQIELVKGDAITIYNYDSIYNASDVAVIKDADGNIVPHGRSMYSYYYIASKDTTIEISFGQRFSYYKFNAPFFEYIIERTNDMMGVNGTMQQLYPEAAQEGKYYDLSGEVADNVGYNISAPVSLNEGDTLLVKSLSFANVAMIKDADGNIVPARSTTQNGPTFYSYTATKATTVEISYRNDGAALFYKFNSSVFEQLAKQITANKGGDSGNLLLELPYLSGNFSTPTLGSGITDMPTLVAKIKAAKSVTLRNLSGSSVACSYWNVSGGDTAVRLITIADTLNQENVLRSNVQITYTASSGNFFINIVTETVQTYVRVNLLAYKQNATGVDLGMSFDELKALVNDESKTIILANNNTETADERVVIARLVSDDGAHVYLACAGADASAASRVDAGNTFIRYNVSQNADDASKCDITVTKVFSQERLLLKFPTFNGVWNTATLADGIDDMAALLDRLASHPVVLLQSGDTDFRQCLRYVAEPDEQRVYFYIAGNKINGQGENIYALINVTYDTETAQFKAKYAAYPDENGSNVEIVATLPETPDENTVYIIKGS